MSEKVYEALVKKYFDPSSDPFFQQFQQYQQAVAAAMPHPIKPLVFTVAAKSANPDLGKEMEEALNELRNRLSSDPKNCVGCKVELCQYLDAYYGKNPDGKRHCSKCRRKKRID